MMMKNNEKLNARQPVIFVHSLFRSGSTYIYNALKRTGYFHVYHEPMHEVIASLPNAWDELVGRKDQLKSVLRHDFLVGGYFDEFSHLLPSIKKTFSTKLSFDFYFMEAGDQAPELKAYIDLLVDCAPKTPVLQCTRTAGRIGWLKENYESKHVFLLRNPWDQWYSYKVTPYIATTPRVIYSQSNIPAVLVDVLSASGATPLLGDATHAKIVYGFNHPLSPTEDYFLFFGLWLHAFISGKQRCDVFIDMDELSSNEAYLEQSLAKLVAIGIKSIDLSDVNLHRTVFSFREQATYKVVEEQVLEIFRQHRYGAEILNTVREYLQQRRNESFKLENVYNEPASGLLEDASRMREILLVRDRECAKGISSLNQAVAERDERIASLNQALSERDGQIASLSQAVAERDGQIASLNQALTEREITIQALKQSTSWLITAPLRATSRLFKRTEKVGCNVPVQTAIVTSGADAFFTICAKNFLAHARVLYNSVRPHYPNARFFVVLCDRVDGLFNPEQEPFEFVFLEDLNLPNLGEMAARYNITEFNTAVKPFAFTHLMTKFGFGSVVYLDPDLFFVDKMDELDMLLNDGAEAVLTPHILQPAEHDEVHDGKMLLYGIYNLGFLALRNTPAVRAFLSWWGRRLERDCVIRLEEGLFVDQKWADLLPAFIPRTRILHHPGYNVAYWNLPQRKISRHGGRWMANGEPLRFVHFSGIKLDDVTVFSRHSQQVTIETIGDLRELLNTYREQVYQQGYAFYRKLPYAYSWNGETGVNLHTPMELDFPSAEIKPADVVSKAQQTAPARIPRAFSGIWRRVALVRQAIPLAKRLTGGWAPFARRAWRSYRLHGWHYVKAKAVELGGYRVPPPTATIQATDTAQRSSASRRLLYLDWAIPKPDQDAASVTAKLLMEIVDSLGYRVTFVPCNLKYEEGYYEDLIAANIEVIVYPGFHSVDEWLTANANNFDICIMARGPVVWPYLATLKKVAPNLRLIFNTVDLHYLRELRQADLANDEKARAAALNIRDQEFELIEKCDLTILLSQEEMYAVRQIKPAASLAILPVVFRDIPGATKPFEDRRDILFIGSFLHQPNIDAVLYFAKAVFPIIRQRLPDIRFKVIGSNPPESIQRLAESPGIEILGFVKDLEPVFSDIRLSVAPLRYGAGIKGKIATSICYGVPCVATPAAIEGMGLIDGKNVLVGDTPEQLAEAVCTAYLDADKWNALSNEGHRFALDNYSVSVIRDRVSNILWATTEGWRPMQSAVELDGWDAFQKHSERLKNEYDRRVLLEQSLLPTDGSESFKTPGFCCVCGQATNFLTSFMYSTGLTPDGRSMPNWREHMQCEHCGLVNRVRAAIHALHTCAQPKTASRIYITERLTKTYSWLEKRYVNLQGSEYFGPNHKLGAVMDGIRHEDVMNLSFEDNSFDFVLSFDVLEHIPFPEKAFKEIYRVLDENGLFLFSVPFLSNSLSDVIRASMRNDGSIEHHLPAEYHGNPVEPEGGALCFRYFGWKMLDQLRKVGFKNVRCLAYWSEEQGYLGKEQYLFFAKKSVRR